MFRIIAIISFAALASACAQPAYVQQAGEFNRNSSNFGKDVTDIKSVTICYSSRGSTPAQVRSLATAECAKFGKSVRFINQDYVSCPLQTPVSAYFSCIGDGVDRSSGSAANPVGTDSHHQINYDGILFSY